MFVPPLPLSARYVRRRSENTFRMTRTAHLRSLLFLLSTVLLQLSAQELLFRDRSEQEMFTAWKRDRILDRSIIECLLTAEGATVPPDKVQSWLAKLEMEARNVIRPDDAPKKKGERLYQFVHSRLLRKFSNDAAAASLIAKGEYNCVTSTAIYAHLAKAVGLPVSFHATPFHVCPIVTVKDRKIWVEMTRPKGGFDAEYDKEALVEMLLENKLVTREEAEQKSEETIYNEFVHGHYQDSSAALLGYHYYNQALALDKIGKREEAFWALAKAHTLETEDDIVKQVFDASFAVLSSIQNPAGSYAQAAHVYFTLRGNDSTVFRDAVTNVHQGIYNLIEHHRNFSRADSILTMLSALLPPNPALVRPLAEIRQFVRINIGLEHNRKGRYQESYAVISAELTKDSANAKLQDLYVQAGRDYVQKLQMSGNEDLALAVTDSMIVRMPSYEVLKETYCRIIVAGTMLADKYRADPSKARINLLKAFAMDSVNMVVREALGAVYHELAMEQIRKTNWNGARTQVLHGLRYAPESQFLKSDLQLIQKETPKPKKKK
jgi:tetratricopeptide (TPR) repeat protein